MTSNYKRLGDYIKEVNIRNADLKIEKLIGVSIEKKFISSVANIVGTDMSVYKIIKKNQLACKLMSVGRDEKLPVDLYMSDESAIISSAYYVFEPKDHEVLLPEYLKMWLFRTETDRYVGYISGGDVRGGISWDTFCNMPIIIPSIEKQQEIVQEYNTIQNRIALNNQLISKLEETAQAIYKQWFVDFEFPDEKGKPYKSNGGKMVWCEELEKEIPEGWELTELKNIIENFDSKRKPITGSDRISVLKSYPYYGAASLMDYIDDFIFDGEYILMGEDGSVITENGTPVLQYVWGKFWVNNHAHVLKGTNGFNENSLYVLLKNTNVTDIITGGVQLKINQTNLNSLKIIKPTSVFLNEFNKILNPIFNLFKSKKTENQKLFELKDLLLAKMTRVNLVNIK
jgi:type I restriction enzyme S subunit